MKTTTRASIGELCEIVRGISPTLKTGPGEYPLVVTAAFRRSSAEWQLEGPAVCVPLVSSTGHGDAAIHRVHYQEGKFALANLLVALKPKHRELCNAKYLYYLLQARKDEILVPLMLGTANVSLKERDISGVEISLPTIFEQEKVVTHIENLFFRLDEAKQTSDASMVLAPRLLSAMAHRADLPSEAKLADGWKRFKLHDLLKEYSDPCSVQADQNYPNFGIYSFGRGLFEKAPISGLETSASKLYRARSGLFIYSRLFAFEGAYAVVDGRFDGYFVSNEYPMFLCDEDRIIPEFLASYVLPTTVWRQIADGSGGLGDRRQRVQPSHFLNLSILVPPIEWQKKIKVTRERLSKLAAIQLDVSHDLNSMKPAILHKTFRGLPQ